MATVAFYEIAGPRTALPGEGETLTVAEQARRALMALYGRANGGAVSLNFAGKDAAGRSLSGHRHAFYLPRDTDGDGRLDQILVCAPDGFSARETRALLWLNRIWLGRARPPLLVQLRDLGRAEELAAAAPALGPAREWVSVTPYVLARHPKTDHRGRPRLGPDGRQVDGPEAQVLREWRQRAGAAGSLADAAGGDAAAAALPDIELIDAGPAESPAGTPWAAFRRRRACDTLPLRAAPPRAASPHPDDGRKRPYGYALGLRIVFARPLVGPLALGYGCHFGLGQFRPAGEGSE